jgi:hypothetical protein
VKIKKRSSFLLCLTQKALILIWNLSKSIKIRVKHLIAVIVNWKVRMMILSFNTRLLHQQNSTYKQFKYQNSKKHFCRKWKLDSKTSNLSKKQNNHRSKTSKPLSSRKFVWSVSKVMFKKQLKLWMTFLKHLMS